MAEAHLRRIVVSTADLERSLHFYRNLLGLRELSSGQGRAMLALDGRCELMLHERPADPSDAGVSLGFAISDLDAVVARWLSGGGTVIDPPAEQPWGEKMAVVRDPDGHIVCLIDR